MYNDYNDVRRRLNAYRLSLDLSQQEMAAYCGVGQSRYSKMESGDELIAYQNLMSLYHNNLDVDYLITEVHSKQTVLNDYLQDCPAEKRERFAWLTAWAIEQEILRNKIQASGIYPHLFYELEVVHQCMSTGKNVWVAVRNVYQISQSEMAKGLLISLKRYRNIEKKLAFPDAEVFLQLYEYLACRPSLILSDGTECTGVMNEIWELLNAESQTRIMRILLEGLQFLKA